MATKAGAAVVVSFNNMHVCSIPGTPPGETLTLTLTLTLTRTRTPTLTLFSALFLCCFAL